MLLSLLVIKFLACKSFTESKNFKKATSYTKILIAQVFLYENERRGHGLF